MVQAEVADRIQAAIGTREYSAYTAKLALLTRASGSFPVARTAFLPPPRVDSTVIRLDRDERTASAVQYLRVREVIDTAFSMRRKTLRNNLRTRYRDETIDAALKHLRIDPRIRAEMLGITQFIELTDALGRSSERGGP
jgi:16S rRNA (adenine1518-N6/adenine1519-N6)-dimethyltransferase